MLQIPPPRPDNSPETVADIVSATLSAVTQARAAYQLDDQRVMIVVVPYDPALHESWKQAEPQLAAARIQLDWGHWNVWTIPRGEPTGGPPTEWTIRPSHRLASVPAWARGGLDPDGLRALAAEAMAMAEYLEKPDAVSDCIIEGGL